MDMLVILRGSWATTRDFPKRLKGSPKPCSFPTEFICFRVWEPQIVLTLVEVNHVNGNFACQFSKPTRFDYKKEKCKMRMDSQFPKHLLTPKASLIHIKEK